MKYFTWSLEKNELLKQQRVISFEEIVFHIQRGDIADLLEHPNQSRYPSRYPDQRVFVVIADQYAYLVPFVETDKEVILKTIIPSRKAEISGRN